MQFKPLNDWIVLKEDVQGQAKTASGLISSIGGLPVVGQGVIMAISPRTQKELKEQDGVELNVGDRVTFSKFQAEELRILDDNGLWMEHVKVVYKFAIHSKLEPNG